MYLAAYNNTHFFPRRPEVQSYMWAWLGFLLSVSQGRAVFLSGGSGNQFASGLIQFIGRIQFLMVVRLGSSFP